MIKIAIIFGGSGFVGQHLVRYLVDHNYYDQIIVGDLVLPPIQANKVIYLATDIRKPINVVEYQPFTNDADVAIYNLAAICRLPGYPDRDYFETNIKGAENVCQFAEQIGCNNIVFTSSIAIYGTSETEKHEDNLPQPDNPYGISKLVAEHIHQTWHAGDPRKRLHILRPGIIFGQNENANFTRLYRALAGRYFFYPGRRDTCKAAIYVKDVVALCYHFAKNILGINVYNLTYCTPHSIEEICEAIARVTGLPQPRISVPGWLLMLVAHSLKSSASLIGIKDVRFHPNRVKKLMVSTNISGEKLKRIGYELSYDLEDALRDWLSDNDGKGLY